MSSLSIKTAVSVYGKFACEATGKATEDFTVEDLVRGIVAGRAREGDAVDRVVCYRSVHDPDDIQLSYCTGVSAAVAVLSSRYTADVRLIYLDGQFTDGMHISNPGVPQYLRDALSMAVRPNERGGEDAKPDAGSAAAEATPSEAPREAPSGMPPEENPEGARSPRPWWKFWA